MSVSNLTSASTVSSAVTFVRLLGIATVFLAATGCIPSPSCSPGEWWCYDV